MLPQSAVIAVTYRCNSRCLHCSIWSMKSVDEAPPSFYVNLPETLREINISGGEPFLRDDLFEICETLDHRCRKPRILINTNGLLPERIERTTKELIRFFRIAVRVSIDGLERTNDSIRGIEGHFKKAIETLERLKRIGLKDVGISFTLAKGNESELLDVYKICVERGLDFTVTTVHSSPIYFGESAEMMPDPTLAVNSLKELAKKMALSTKPKRWFRARYLLELARFIETKRRSFKCGAGRLFFFLDPSGVAYPCPILPLQFGNLNDASYEEFVLFSERVKNEVEKCEHGCFMVCTAAPYFRKHPIRSLLGVWK